MKIKVNPAYEVFLKKQARVNILYGGGDSGKSFFTSTLLLMLLAVKSEKLLVVRKFASTNRDTVFEELLEKIHLLNFEKYCTTDLSTVSNVKPIQFNFGSHQSSIIFRGLDNVEKLKSIKGVSIIWVEEATEITQGDLDQLDIRLRDTNTPRIFLTFNPTSRKHWLRKYFKLPDDPSTQPIIDDSERNILAVWTTYKDNAFCTPERAKVLEGKAEKDYNFYQVYCRGQWGNFMGGLIFTPKKYITNLEFQNIQTNEAFNFFGLDYGFQHPSALVHVKKLNNETFVCKLCVYESKLKTWDLKEKVLDYLVKEKMSHLPIYVDNARPDLIDELVEVGLNAVKADKDVLGGINLVKSIHLEAVDDDDFRNEFENYAYKFNKTTGAFEEKPMKVYDDAMDAMRYAIYTFEKNNGNIFTAGYSFDTNTQNSESTYTETSYNNSEADAFYGLF